MYEEHPSTAKHYLADVPVEMPLDILLALPDYVTDDPGAPTFNLPAVVARLLGRFGWERASKILNPKIWAPAWTREQIQRFASSPFSERPELFEGVPASRLAMPNFPGTGALRDLERPDFPQYEIIHFTGAVEWKDGDRAIRVSEHERWWLHAGALQAAVRAARTRLLILQVAVRHHREACELARSIVDAGGPTALVVACVDPELVNAYFVDLYAEIVHNKPLESAVEPKPWIDQKMGPDLIVNLYYGPGGSDVLGFQSWLKSLQERARELTRKVESLAEPQVLERFISSLRSGADPFLHRSQAGALESHLGEAKERLASLKERVVKMSTDLEAELDWAHEGKGAEPLSRIAKIVPQLEAEAAEATHLYPALTAEVSATIENAPRVLNANFADPTDGRVLQPFEGLVTGREYDLLVDVGPRWNKIPTIVSGHAEFPADALPPDQSGHLIHVMLVSDEFEPQMVLAKMWLPQARGRSHPWVEDRPAPTSGPIKLRVTAPAVENLRAQSREARSRLFLYYENNLLQSAVVAVGVVREPGVTLDRENRVEVDYMLTGTFRDVESQFGRREIRLAGDDAAGSHPVRLNITLNHDGRGTHRILVQGRDDLAPAWTAYDPAAALEALRAARRTIYDCFWKRDDVGNFVLDRSGQRVPGLDKRNGKPRKQFRFDLFFLAKVGNRLYNEMIHQLRPGSGEKIASLGNSSSGVCSIRPA
jgi:hypothetical protein